MNNYIVTLKYTKMGYDTLKVSPGRSGKMMAIMREKFGGGIKDYWLTMGGDCDFVVLFEAPDDKTMMKILLEVNRLGAVTTTVMRAFTRAEFGEIVAELPEKSVFSELAPA
jgi:uncharacterized protein with GYD domain